MRRTATSTRVVGLIDQLRITRQRGFTLIEVLMTIVVMGILAAVAMRSVQSSINSSRVRETQSEMDELVYGIAGNPDLVNNGMRSDFGYVGDVGALPSTLDNLMTNPGGYSTWKGPYLSNRFTQDIDGYKRDAWANLYTFSSGITVSSTGGGATPMTKSAASSAAALTSTPITGSITDAAGNPPGDSNVAVTVTVTYPNGTGGTTTASANPSKGGSFTINSIPVGVRQVRAVYRATSDTVYAYVAALPSDGATVVMRLPDAPFAGSGGSGSSSAAIQFVPGTASSPGNDVYFSIFNAGNMGVAVTSITTTWSPTAYYTSVYWGGTTVVTFSPRLGSGAQGNFTTTATIAVGQTVAIRLMDFFTTVGGATTADMSNQSFTVTFSNGQSITFNSL